jgi:hypothetical protein
MHLDSVSPKITETSNNHSLSTPEQLSNKFDHIFKYILKDQSTQTPKKPIYKSKWTKHDKKKIDTIKNEYQQIHLHDRTSISACLDSVEDIAYRLSGVIRTQLSKAEIAQTSNNSSSRRNVNSSVTYSGGNNVTFSSGSYTISSCIGSEALTQFMQDSNLSTLKSNSDDVQVSIDGYEVKRTDSNIFKAVGFLDKICLEIFSHRFVKQEIHKAAAALAKMSCDSTKKQKTALNSLSNHCNGMLVEENLKGVVALYDGCLTEENGVLLVNRLNKKLIKLDPTNKDKIQTIIASLNSDHIQLIQSWIMEGIQDDKMPAVLQYIDLLIQNPNLDSWCQTQIITIIEKYLQNNKDESAIKLIGKYLLNNQTAIPLGMAYVSSIIKKNIEKGYHDTATKLIDKYLLNNPETHAQGMAYVGSIIKKNIENGYHDTATKLIDKYLLNNPETHAQGMAYVGSIIKKNIENSYHDTATKLIDKYLLNNPETHAEGMTYVGSIIKKNIENGYHDTATKLIDKYLLNNPETHAQGMAYVGSIIKKNIENGYHDTATKLIDKYLLNNPETHAEGMTYVHFLIKKNIENGYDTTATKLIDDYLMKHLDTSSLGLEYYCELINRCIRNGYGTSADKLIARIEPFVIETLSLPNFTDHHRNILRKFVKGLSNSHTSDKVITVLSFAKMKLNDQAFVKELAQLFVAEMRHIDLTKANIVTSLFLS